MGRGSQNGDMGLVGGTPATAWSRVRVRVYSVGVLTVSVISLAHGIGGTAVPLNLLG